MAWSTFKIGKNTSFKHIKLYHSKKWLQWLTAILSYTKCGQYGWIGFDINETFSTAAISYTRLIQSFTWWPYTTIAINDNYYYLISKNVVANNISIIYLHTQWWRNATNIANANFNFPTPSKRLRVNWLAYSYVLYMLCVLYCTGWYVYILL